METSSSECSLGGLFNHTPPCGQGRQTQPSGRSIITAEPSSLWIHESNSPIFFSDIHENISHSSLKNKYKLKRETERAATNLCRTPLFLSFCSPKTGGITQENNSDSHRQQTATIKVNCVSQCNV